MSQPVETIIDEVTHVDEDLGKLNVGDLVIAHYKKAKDSVEHNYMVVGYVRSVAEDQIVVANAVPYKGDKLPWFTEKRLTLRRDRIFTLERILRKYREKKSEE